MSILQNAWLRNILAAVLELSVVIIFRTGCGVDKVVREELENEDYGKGDEVEEIENGSTEKAGSEVKNRRQSDEEP